MVAVDTNILVYVERIGDPVRIARANDVLMAVPRKELVIPAQVLAELFRVLRRKLGLPPEPLRSKLAYWEKFGLIAPTMSTTIESAFDLAAEHGFQVFDAIILAAASEAGCRMLISEDMQDGFVWRGVTIVNPFAATPHPMLADLMRRSWRGAAPR